MHGNIETRPATRPRRTVLRAPWRACLGLVLLAGAVLTALPGTARAQDTVLWSATLTVGFLSTTLSDNWGYSHPDEVNIGSLMPSTFEWDGTTYRVAELLYKERKDDRDVNRLSFIRDVVGES